MDALSQFLGNQGPIYEFQTGLPNSHLERFRQLFIWSNDTSAHYLLPAHRRTYGAGAEDGGRKIPIVTSMRSDFLLPNEELVEIMNDTMKGPVDYGLSGDWIKVFRAMKAEAERDAAVEGGDAESDERRGWMRRFFGGEGRNEVKWEKDVVLFNTGPHWSRGHIRVKTMEEVYTFYTKVVSSPHDSFHACRVAV